VDKDAIIKQLTDTIDQFKRETELLKGRIKEPEAKLAMYENAHTPPSLKRDGKRKKDQNKCGEKKMGHKGVTRPPAKPDRHVNVMKDRCPVLWN
jgi:hypothetical protein